jgi:HSP20 family protein
MDRTEKKDIDQVAEGTHSGRYYEPLVDIYEDERALTLLADMPGVGEKDVDIDLREGVLTILGKYTPVPRSAQAEHLEFDSGNYLRKFTLTDVIDQEKISAVMRDGVLTVTLPKAAAARPRQIKVQAG